MSFTIKSEIQKSLIIFADVIDSSKYSSVLGIKQYCDNILRFQELFSSLANTYFSNAAYTNKYCSVRIHGDEGAVFLIAPEVRPDELIFKAVQFSFELKARMELEFYEVNEAEKVPQKMTVGIGIHFGEVALVHRENGKLQVGIPPNFGSVDRVEGYTINYAKRVESCSRLGKYSQIFLSKESADIIKNKPVILEKYEANLKGISLNDDVSEVRAAFFSELPLDKDSIDYGKFLAHYTSDVENLNLVRKPWLKSLIVSVMDTANRNAHFEPEAQRVWAQMVQFAWKEHNEDDPILLYLRTIDLKTKGEHSRRVALLKELLARYPSFISAKKELIKGLWEVASGQAVVDQNVEFIKNMATDFLENYVELLKEKEIDEFKKIIE